MEEVIPNVYSMSERWSSQSSKALVEVAAMLAAMCGSEGVSSRKKKSSTSPGNQSQILPPVYVRYAPRHASHP